MFPSAHSGLTMQQNHGWGQQRYLQQPQAYAARNSPSSHPVLMDGQHPSLPTLIQDPDDNLISFDDLPFSIQSTEIKNESMPVHQPQPLRPHLKFRSHDIEEPTPARQQSVQMFPGLQAQAGLPNNVQAPMFGRSQDAQVSSGIQAQADSPSNIQAPIPARQQSARTFPGIQHQATVPSNTSFVMHSAHAARYLPFANCQSATQRNLVSGVDNVDAKYRNTSQRVGGRRPVPRRQDFHSYGPTMGIHQGWPRLKVVSNHDLIQRNNEHIITGKPQNRSWKNKATKRTGSDRLVDIPNKPDGLSNTIGRQTISETVDQTRGRLPSTERPEHNQQPIAKTQTISSLRSEVQPQREIFAESTIMPQHNNLPQISGKLKVSKHPQLEVSERKPAPARVVQSNQYLPAKHLQCADLRKRNNQANRSYGFPRSDMTKMTNRSIAYRQNGVDHKKVVPNTASAPAHKGFQGNSYSQINIQSDVIPDKVQSQQAQVPPLHTAKKDKEEDDYRPSFHEVFGNQDFTPPRNKLPATLPSIPANGDRPPTLGELMELRNAAIKQKEVDATIKVAVIEVDQIQRSIDIGECETIPEHSFEPPRSSEEFSDKSRLNSIQSASPVASIDDADKLSDHTNSVDDGDGLSASQSESVGDADRKLNETGISAINEQAEAAMIDTVCWKAKLVHPTTLSVNVLSPGRIPRSNQICETCGVKFSSALEVIGHKLRNSCRSLSSRATLVQNPHTEPKLPSSDVIIAQLVHSLHQRAEDNAAIKNQDTANSRPPAAPTPTPTSTPTPTPTIAEPARPVKSAPVPTPAVARKLPPPQPSQPNLPPTVPGPHKKTRRSRRRGKGLNPPVLAVPVAVAAIPQTKPNSAPASAPQVQNKPRPPPAVLLRESAPVGGTGSGTRGRGRFRGRGVS